MQVIKARRRGSHRNPAIGETKMGGFLAARASLLSECQGSEIVSL